MTSNSNRDKNILIMLENILLEKKYITYIKKWLH